MNRLRGVPRLPTLCGWGSLRAGPVPSGAEPQRGPGLCPEASLSARGEQGQRRLRLPGGSPVSLPLQRI